jgi:isoquinoline 1-oxidoreductase
MAKPIEQFEPERYELREPAPSLFAVNRREFFEIAGAGLTIVAAAGPAGAQRRGGGASLEARLHVGESGTIAILSGKIEEGQGVLTELAMAAAEESGAPLAHILVILADTERVPDDGITAGSGSTPRTVPLVRRAAAAARGLLVTAAARQWGVDPAQVAVRDGAATHQGRTFSYGELARTPLLADAYKLPLPEGVTLTAPAGWKVLGKPQVRIDARDVVTGARRFPSDIVRPGMLYGAVLRAPAYGATLTGLDLAAAKGEGVAPVRDGDFVGCAAPTAHAARKAVAALAATAQWKTTDQPSSQTLFEHLKQHARGAGRGGGSSRDVAAGLAGAARRLKAAYRVAYVQHAPMEPRAAVAEWRDGRLTVWTGSSNPFGVRRQLVEAFRVPQERVRVIVPHMGGGFGGKHTGEAAIEAARLAKEAGRPVRLQWTRAEEFTWAYFRPAALIEIEAGLAADGAIAAWDFVNYNSGASALDTPYRAGARRTRFIESDSPLRQGSYRCLAATANNFAREAFTDELAEAAGKDPLAYRLAHLENERIRKVVEAAAEKFGWAERRRRRRAGVGVGMACGTEKNSVVAACVEATVGAEGEIKVVEVVEAFECGPILNPANLRQQVEGAIMMGLGPALREEIRFAGGKVANGRFSAYRAPRFRDLPKIETVLVDRRDGDSAGAGETPIIAIAPALANAVFDATGKRVRSMPIQLPKG